MTAVSTGWIVALVGVIVSLAAWTLWMGTMFGAGLFGFGLAHILLGVLDALFDRRSVPAGEG
ncbi:MAG: hypothetical protein DIU82_10890 [Bacillota bacterium]|nr:MAG: hypothetical protein DIU82_10890 [Bacillota bacterium]